MQSEQKAEFIGRIFSMPSDVQTALMEQLKQLQEHLDSTSESKDLIRTLEELEEENEVLRDEVRDKQEANYQLQEELTEQKSEADKHYKEVRKYEAEKMRVMKELAITDLQ